MACRGASGPDRTPYPLRSSSSSASSSSSDCAREKSERCVVAPTLHHLACLRRVCVVHPEAMRLHAIVDPSLHVVVGGMSRPFHKFILVECALEQRSQDWSRPLERRDRRRRCGKTCPGAVSRPRKARSEQDEGAHSPRQVFAGMHMSLEAHRPDCALSSSSEVQPATSVSVGWLCAQATRVSRDPAPAVHVIPGSASQRLGLQNPADVWCPQPRPLIPSYSLRSLQHLGMKEQLRPTPLLQPGSQCTFSGSTDARALEGMPNVNLQGKENVLQVNPSPSAIWRLI